MTESVAPLLDVSFVATVRALQSVARDEGSCRVWLAGEGQTVTIRVPRAALGAFSAEAKAGYRVRVVVEATP